VAQHGWSGCTSCSLLGKALAATVAPCHRLAVTPLCICFNVSVKCECRLCRLSAISHDICGRRYRKADTSAIDITISPLPCTELFVEPCHPSQRYCVTAETSVCSTEHTGGPTLHVNHIQPSSIFCHGSHSVEQSSCCIQRSDNQRCLLPTAFKDSTVYTTASAP